MVWIVLVVVAALFLVGVAIHFSRLEKIQSDCMQSLENLRDHHSRFIAGVEQKFGQQLEQVKNDADTRIIAFTEKNLELENKLKAEQHQRLRERQNFNQECEKLNRERATLETQVAELKQENVLLSSIISNVKDAVGVE